MEEVTVDVLNLQQTDFFSKHQKFDETPDVIDTRNLLEYGEDGLFSWNHDENCLVVLLTKSLVDENRIIQKLRLTETIPDEVIKLVLNHQRTRIALCCKKDVYVVDLPFRSGRYGSFKGGVADITCSCRRLFVDRGLTNIRRVHWYPDIQYDCYLAVLTADNVIHMSDVRAQSPTFVDVWIFSSATLNRIPSLESVGLLAADFHFIPPASLKRASAVNSNNQCEESMKWPALVLYENGDVVIIDLVVKREGRKFGKTTTPLLMYPSAEDNYGVDCCEILILDGPLPLVVIASSTGILYHCILLNYSPDYQNYNFKGADNIRYGPRAAMYVLHVIESVELDIGLNLGSNGDDTLDEIVSSPIKLVEDRTCDTRYFATHVAGVHSISLPIIHELRIFFSKNYNSVDLPPQTVLDFRRNRCVVEYVVCSQITGSKPCPVLGTVCIESPGSVLVILFPDKIISLRITSWFISPQKSELCGKTKETPVDEVKPPSFQECLQNILKPDNKSTPVFKITDPTNPTPEQSLELLARATAYFREIIIPRHEQAAQLIRTKVRMLIKMKERQLEDIKEVQQMKKTLQGKAESLAEKYDDINEKQMELADRAEQALIIVRTKDKSLTKSEKIMLDNLMVIKKQVDNLKDEADRVRLKKTTEDEILALTEKKFDELYLSDTHFQTINSNFSIMNAEISNLVSQIKEAENELDFDISMNN